MSRPEMDDPTNDPMSLAAERLKRRAAEAEEKTERLAAFTEDLRQKCRQLGGQPGLVKLLHVEGLLAYYEELFERDERERMSHRWLMQQPPEAA